MSSREQIEELAKACVNGAFIIHKALGPGLLESVYEAALKYELQKQGMSARTQAPVPVIYDGQDLSVEFRADLIVEDAIIIEVKPVEKIHPVRPKQLLTYLKVMNRKLGLPINFNERVIKNGIQRIVNEL